MYMSHAYTVLPGTYFGIRKIKVRSDTVRQVQTNHKTAWAKRRKVKWYKHVHEYWSHIHTYMYTYVYGEIPTQNVTFPNRYSNKEPTIGFTVAHITKWEMVIQSIYDQGLIKFYKKVYKSWALKLLIFVHLNKFPRVTSDNNFQISDQHMSINPSIEALTIHMTCLLLMTGHAVHTQPMKLDYKTIFIP